MTCVIEEFPLLPFEPVPRGETLAHWRNEIAEWAEGLQPLICRETPEVDLSGINQAVADFQQLMEDFENRLPPFPYTPLGIVYAPDAVNLGQIAIGTANQVLGVNSTGAGYEYKTIQGTANEIDVTHGAGTITIGLVDPLIVTKGGTGASTATAAFNNLSPTTTRGDLIVRDASSNVRFPVGTVGKYIRSDGTDPGYSVLLASDLSGTVDVPHGGTGVATLTGILQGNGVSAVTGITGTANKVPKWSATAPYLTSTSLITDDGTQVTLAGNLTFSGAARKIVFADEVDTIRIQLFTGYHLGIDFTDLVSNIGTDPNTGWTLKTGGLVGGTKLFRITQPGVVTINAANPLAWGSSSTDTPDLLLYRGGAALLGFGGTTSSFPGLKRNAAVLEVKLADNSAYAGLKAENLTLVTALSIANGGTGSTTALAAFNALSPLTTRGDLLTRDATNNVRLAIGAAGRYLYSDGVDVSWNTAPGGEANTASNVGTVGTGVFKQKTGVDLEFYKLNPASNKLTIAVVSSDRIDFTIDSNNVVAASTDSRLSDARTPTAHASTHFSAGSDAIRIDELKVGTDVTTLNATVTEHGLLKKLSGNATDFFNGAGNWSVPTGIAPLVHNVLDSTYHGDVLTGSITRGDLLIGNSTPKISRLGIGTVGKYLRTDGTDPSWNALLASDLSGQVSVANGGTGAATLTGILQGNGTSAVTAINGTADVIPKWSASAPYLADSLLHSGTNLVEQYDSTNAQSWSLFGTRTSAVVYERMTVKHNASASGITFTSEAAGGGTIRDFIFAAANVGIGGAPLAKFHVIKGSAAGTPAINAQTTAVFQNTAATNSDAFYSLIAGNVGSSVVMFGDNDAEFRGRVSYAHATDDLAFWTAGAEAVRITSGKNICLGVTAAGTSATQTVVIESALAPSGDVTNAFQLYSQDITAGNAAAHIRTENGAVIRIFRDTGWTLPTGTALKGGWATATVTPTQLAQTVKAILDHLHTNMGLVGT